MSQQRIENREQRTEKDSKRAVLYSLFSVHGRAHRGFTLLLAALVASIAFSLGSSIYSIVIKELDLSSIGQSSQFAFYAADTVAECALYWDSRIDKYPNTFATSSVDTSATPSVVNCDGIAATILSSDPPTATAATTTLEFANLFADNGPGYCAVVEVGKSANASSGAINTTIIANGYSVSCDTIETAQSALQRTVELQY